ncbi:hypothetical protein ABPG74_011907 [Tetrahymena malaccensis]
MSFCSFLVKFYLIIGAIINCVIGVACFLIANNLKNFNSDFLVVGEYKDAKLVISIIFYIFGSLLVVSTFSAMIGFFFDIRFLQIIFTFLNIIFFLLFLSIFFFTVYADSYVSKELSDQNCTTGPLKVANDVFDTAQQYWCKNINVQGQIVGCPCNIQNKSQWSPDDQAILSTYNGISASGTNSVDDCAIFQQELNGNSNEVEFLKLIEETFECTGICKGDIIYYFSDINRGPTDTTQGCYIQIRDYIFNLLNECHIYSIVAFSIELTSTIFTLINFWIIKKNKQKQSKAQKIYNKDFD